MDGRNPLLHRALIFYAAFLAVAIAWRMGLQGESLVLASAGDRVRWLRDLLLGLGAGALVILGSAELTARTRIGAELARALAAVLGPLRTRDCLDARAAERRRRGGAVPRRAPAPRGPRLGERALRARASGSAPRAAALVRVLARRGFPARRSLRRDGQSRRADRRPRRDQRGEPAQAVARRRLRRVNWLACERQREAT